MALLIDGYNLLHGTDLFGRGKSAGTLEASREALLRFVIASLEPDELAQTTIVFDSKDAPPGLPRTLSRKGLTIRFATGYADADELLEELILADNAPKKLTVVSSDHQVQRAARRRRSQYIDSQQWYFETRQRRSRSAGAASDAKPEGPFSSEEIAFFVREFALVADLEEPSELFRREESSESKTPESSASPTSGEPATDDSSSKLRKGRKPGRRKSSGEIEEKPLNLSNPFPPGYGEDVLAEEGEA